MDSCQHLRVFLSEVGLKIGSFYFDINYRKCRFYKENFYI